MATSTVTNVPAVEPAAPALPSLDALLGATIIPDATAVTAAWAVKATREKKDAVPLTDTLLYKIVAHYSEARPAQSYAPGQPVLIPWQALAGLPQMAPNAGAAKRGRKDRPEERVYKALRTAGDALPTRMYVRAVTDTERKKAGALISSDACAFLVLPDSERPAPRPRKIKDATADAPTENGATPS